jgi:hypothetical protein
MLFLFSHTSIISFTKATNHDLVSATVLTISGATLAVRVLTGANAQRQDARRDAA